MKENILKGKTIVTTRPSGKERELVDALSGFGAEVYNLPTIEIQPAKINYKTEMVLTKLHKYDWLLLTSQNGVTAFLELMKHVHGNWKLPTNLKIGVYGEKSSKELAKNNITPDFVCVGESSLVLYKQLKGRYLQKNQNVLLMLGDLADKKYEPHFNGFVNYTRLNVYQTTTPKEVNPKLITRIKDNAFDLIVFTSPSTFKNLLELTDHEVKPKDIKAASIGPSTTKAIRNLGGEPLLTARKPDIQTLTEDILHYFQQKKK